MFAFTSILKRQNYCHTWLAYVLVSHKDGIHTNPLNMSWQHSFLTWLEHHTFASTRTISCPSLVAGPSSFPPQPHAPVLQSSVYPAPVQQLEKLLSLVPDSHSVVHSWPGVHCMRTVYSFNIQIQATHLTLQELLVSFTYSHCRASHWRLVALGTFHERPYILAPLLCRYACTVYTCHKKLELFCKTSQFGNWQTSMKFSAEQVCPVRKPILRKLGVCAQSCVYICVVMYK